MMNSLAVFVAGLIRWPIPGYVVRFEAGFASAERFEASFASADIEKQIADELRRQALVLRGALKTVKPNTLNTVKTNTYLLSHGARPIFTRNQFFATCGLSGSAVRELAGGELQLRALGKLAKSGDFLVSTDRRWLLKAVSFDEEAKLKELGTVDVSQTEYSDCYGFNHTLLLPIPLAFIGTNRKAYLVMQNETELLANRIRPGWQVAQVFDVKPLPNLAGQLAELVSTLSTAGWLGSFGPLSTWDGWDDVSNALHRDCQLLTLYNVVDFSLFIHILQRTSVTHSSFPDLSVNDGCITESSRAAIVCFAILDYLLPFGKRRWVESYFKGDKFQDYGEKMRHAFACIGDLNGKGCQAYHDYSTILNAGVARDKAALLGSQTFRHNYVCQVERPKLRYEHKMFVAQDVVAFAIKDEPPIKGVHENERMWSDEVVELLPQALHSSNWSYDGTGYDPNVSSWLQGVVSSENGAHVVASGYEQLLEHGLEHPEKGFHLYKKELAACKEGIELFARRSWSGRNKHNGLGNIIWSPQSNSLFVVRGKNKLYSNGKVVTGMRQNHCFMLLRFFRCQPLEGKRTIFDYKTSFGSLEVLQVMPHASSDDFEVFRKSETSLWNDI